MDASVFVRRLHGGRVRVYADEQEVREIARNPLSQHLQLQAGQVADARTTWEKSPPSKDVAWTDAARIKAGAIPDSPPDKEGPKALRRAFRAAAAVVGFIGLLSVVGGAALLWFSNALKGAPAPYRALARGFAGLSVESIIGGVIFLALAVLVWRQSYWALVSAVVIYLITMAVAVYQAESAAGPGGAPLRTHIPRLILFVLLAGQARAVARARSEQKTTALKAKPRKRKLGESTLGIHVQWWAGYARAAHRAGSSAQEWLARSREAQGEHRQLSMHDMKEVETELRRLGEWPWEGDVPEGQRLETKTIDLGQGVTMKLMPVPAGEFMMGSPSGQPGLPDDEVPQHPVRITKAFWIGATAVTQAQFEAVMGVDPSRFRDPGSPVERVSWNDAVEFCRRLSGTTGQEVRLPTEAEWEYACRAGTETAFYFGDTINTDQANYDGSYTYAGRPEGAYRGTTTPVGSFAPNAWGLYDMHGNVWEWCRDWYDQHYYAQSSAADPKGPPSGENRVLRGGSWSDGPVLCRSACRSRCDPTETYDNTGFRVVVSPE